MSDDHPRHVGAAPPERASEFGENRHSDRLLYALYTACAVAIVVDILVPKHGPFAVEHWFGFYAFYGLLVAVALLLAARALRPFLMRPEDYYER